MDQQQQHQKTTCGKMADGKLLLEVKNDVKFKKTEGTLRLLKNKLVWIQKGETVPKFECLYSDIKGNYERKKLHDDTR